MSKNPGDAGNSPALPLPRNSLACLSRKISQEASLTVVVTALKKNAVEQTKPAMVRDVSATQTYIIEFNLSDHQVKRKEIII